METAVINTPIQVLDKILALNLDITIWSARSKLTAEDFGGVNLPPDELASLGSKKICDPTKIAVFLKLKARAFSLLDKHGVRFLSGWAIPEDKTSEVVAGLCSIRDDFYTAKSDFLASYEAGIADWINRHPTWGSIISNSTVSKDYVDKKLNFSWQLYRVAPATGLPSIQAMEESGLTPEVENLGETLFDEISKQAATFWKRSLEGKTEVSHRALSPLRTMKEKLNSLTFVAPHAFPIVNLIETALAKVPAKGLITGSSLLMIQGMVCILKDKSALIAQAEAMMMLGATDDGFAGFFASYEEPDPVLNLEDKDDEGQEEAPLLPVSHFDSMGLW